MEHPILFSGSMVRAIMAGKKTMTRRIVKNDALSANKFAGVDQDKRGDWWVVYDVPSYSGGLNELMLEAEQKYEPLRCPYGKAGDRLWVRETFAYYSFAVGRSGHNNPPARLTYAADQELHGYNAWRPSIFMPRAISRITLEVTNVRVERLQDITPRDCQREGIYAEEPNIPSPGCDADSDRAWIAAWIEGWNKINGKRASWESDPWVWVIWFRRANA
jgi:hypothetical protein